MFGSGIYFAENSSKSDEYIVPDSSGNCYIFLSRVIMGVPFVTLTSQSNLKRPPQRSGLILYNSVLAECQETGHKTAQLQRYREFIVYDRKQTYPEFLITFKRV